MPAGRENVAIFNPLVLPLPSWHPDGPDGDVDGYVIPFVMPGRDRANRGARIRVAPTPQAQGDWRASLLNCQDHAETPEQARALAAAWIRAAEVLENASVPQRVLLGDVEHLDDDEPEHLDDDGCRCNSFAGNCPEHGPR